MAEVAAHEGLDLLHVHYAIPHAISAHPGARDEPSGRGPKVVTTLHGTDITIVGQDRSYLPITRYGIERSDAVTAVSQYLTDVTDRASSRCAGRSKSSRTSSTPSSTGRTARPPYARPLLAPGEPFLVHISNFRPVKRIADVLDVFDRIRRRGPRAPAARRGRPGPVAAPSASPGAGIRGPHDLPRQRRLDRDDPADRASLFLLPSDAESFGLVGARGDGVRRSRHRHRPAGFPKSWKIERRAISNRSETWKEWRKRLYSLLRDPEKYALFSSETRRRAVEEFPTETAVARYRKLYEETLGR